MNFVMEWHEIISQKTQLTSQKIESRSELGRKKKGTERNWWNVWKRAPLFFTQFPDDDLCDGMTRNHFSAKLNKQAE